MSTLVSGGSPWCSAAQFLERFDVRTVAEALSDDPDNEPIETAQVATNTKLLALLRGSSGKFEAAVLKGGKYTIADLTTLTTGTSNMKDWIADIVADLTAPKVLGRRFMEFPDYEKRLKDVDDVLAALAAGEAIFGLQEVIDAGVLASEVETPDIVERRNMITTQSSRYFGRRANRNLPGPHDHWDCG